MSTKLILPVTTICTWSESSNEQYGAWSADYDLEVGDVALIHSEKTPRYVRGERESYEGELVEGDLIYVVVANWSSGDSFGHASRCHVEVPCVNKDEATARRNLKELERKRDSKKYDDCNVALMNDDGSVYPYHRSWLGYFESLDSLEIHTMIVKNYNEEDDDV